MHEAGSGSLDGELVGGAYRVVGTIGRGGMGTVYRAVDVASGRQVALKLMLPHLVTPVRMARFAREAEVTARLDRLGGIVRVFASGVHRGAPFFAMELVEGDDLEAVLERGPLPVERAVEVVERVARTMGACHAEGVVHRDLKPGNVLIDAIGPKIVDFGLARDESSEQRLTKTGELVGTPFYMPPEQLGGRPADARADVYALGAILYHALVGQPPFLASSLMELAARVNTADPVRPSKLRPEVPADLDAVVLRALARDAGARYPDAGALAEDLARVQRRERPTASTHTGSWVDVSGIFARARRGDRRAQALVAALGLAALLAVVTAALAVGVVAPRRAAVAALEETLEWDGDRCERAPEACRGGPHRLTRWDLGLGDGPPPSVDELAERAAVVERAGGRLDGADGLAARAQAARLHALRALLGEADATSVAGPTAALVQAVEARGRGDVAVADDQLARALSQEPGWPAALRLDARLWKDRLARGRRQTVVQKLALWLGARGRTDEERALARQAAVEGIIGWYVGAISAAIETHVDPATLRGALDAALAGARDLQVLPEVLAALPAQKVAALEADAERWAGVIAAAAPDERAGVARLGAAMQAEPPVRPGPRLSAALRRVAEDVVDAAARAPSDATVIRAAALDDAIVHEVDPAWTSPPALPPLVFGPPVGGPRVDLERLDLALVLTFLRTTTRRGPVLDTVFRRIGPARLQALAESRPRSLAGHAGRLLVALTGRLELRTGGDDRRLKELGKLADAIEAPDLVRDVSSVYLSDVELELAFVRRCQIDAALREKDEAAARAFLRQAVERARRSRALADPARVDVIRDAWMLEVEAEGLLSAERALAAWEAGIADLRARVARTDRGETVDGLDAIDERQQLVKLLVVAAVWVDRLASTQPEQAERLRQRSLAWGEEALTLTRRFSGHAKGAQGMALSYMVGRARKEGRLDDAEALASSVPEALLESPELACEHCELARARGDVAAFEARLREALARFPKHDGLRALAADAQRGR